MKKIVATLTVLAITMMSVSAFAACGSNASRTAPTRAPGSTGTGTSGAGSGTTTPGAGPAGINR